MRRRLISAMCTLLFAVIVLDWNKDSNPPPVTEIQRSTSSAKNLSDKTRKSQMAVTDSTPKRPVRLLTIAEMAESIRGNRLCRGNDRYVINETDYPEETYKSQLYSALLEANGQNPDEHTCGFPLVSRNRAEALRQTSKSKEAACLFARALILTDQLHFIQMGTATSKEKAEGFRLLSELQRRFPDNGLYTFFRLSQYENDIEKAADVLNEFLKYKRFENPLDSIYETAYRLGTLNGTARLKAVAITAGMNVADYHKGTTVAKAVIEKNMQSPEIESWSENFQIKMEAIDQLDITEPFTSLLEIASLRSIGTAYYRTHHASRVAPGYFNPANFQPYFHRRVVDITAMDDFYFEEMSCGKLAQALDAHQSEHRSQYEKNFEQFEKLQAALDDAYPD